LLNFPVCGSQFSTSPTHAPSGAVSTAQLTSKVTFLIVHPPVLVATLEIRNDLPSPGGVRSLNIQQQFPEAVAVINFKVSFVAGCFFLIDLDSFLGFRCFLSFLNSLEVIFTLYSCISLVNVTSPWQTSHEK
jgi:hypothetical protein